MGGPESNSLVSPVFFRSGLDHVIMFYIPDFKNYLFFDPQIKAVTLCL